MAIRSLAQGTRSAYDETYELLLLAVDRAPNLTFRIARTCVFSVGTAFVYGDLNH